MPHRDLHATIYLSQAEAAQGTRLNARLPTREICPHCGGYGDVGYRVCWQCMGRGYITQEKAVWIDIPGGISDRSTARLSLAPIGLRSAHLVLEFYVRG
jgi:molecular chaperone DnaJ